MNTLDESAGMAAEARAFDSRLAERIAHGHVPDLRRAQPCDWFYNNPWRRPYLAAMDFGRAFSFALRHARAGRLLEIGCGPGHMSLEFARHGFDVIGLDVSEYSLSIARRMLAENPYTDGFGRVRYVNADFLAWQTDERFETVCFFGCLHHFARPDFVLDKVRALLTPDGRILVMEPARDWITDANGAVVALIRILLGIDQRWYNPPPVPQTESDLLRYIKDCTAELKGGNDPDEPEQSPNDNSSAAEGMLAALRHRFQQIECRRLNAFLQRVVGGVRAPSATEERTLAEFLDVFDRVAIQLGVIPPGEMYWAGAKVDAGAA